MQVEAVKALLTNKAPKIMDWPPRFTAPPGSAARSTKESSAWKGAGELTFCELIVRGRDEFDKS